MNDADIEHIKQGIEPIYQRLTAEHDRMMTTIKASLPRLRKLADRGCAALGEEEADRMLHHMVGTIEYLVEYVDMKRIRDDLHDGVLPHVQ